jgi:monothiol glutaredoxin, Grx4 family
MSTDNTTHDIIHQQVTKNPVVLYMKGDPQFPQCGFSHQAVQILKKHQVEFIAINVLENEAIRQGIKAYSDWPTIPQLYIHGEFIGGCDIIKSLDASGDLANQLSESIK